MYMSCGFIDLDLGNLCAFGDRGGRDSALLFERVLCGRGVIVR